MTLKEILRMLFGPVDHHFINNVALMGVMGGEWLCGLMVAGPNFPVASPPTFDL